jgi:hypothetical protein
MLQEALNYLKHGYPVIPIQKDNKKPYISWKKYQEQIPSIDEVTEWWTKFPEANIGLITGVISGIVVVDIDTEEGLQEIQNYIPIDLDIPKSKTPSGGQHWFFLCEDESIGNNVRTISGCDLRANGGYVVLPPSKGYEWLSEPILFKKNINALPNAYINAIKTQPYRDFVTKKDIEINAVRPSLSSLEQGEECYRNAENSCLSVTSKEKKLQLVTNTFLDDGQRDEGLFHIANCAIKGGLEPALTREMLTTLAMHCNPPFPEQEVEKKVLSAIQRANARERTLKDDLVNWLKTATVQSFLKICCTMLHSKL